MQKSGNLFFEFPLDFGIGAFQLGQLSHPITRFSGLNHNGIEFIVGTQQKFAEEGSFRPVFPFGFALELESGTQVLYPFGILLFVEQYFFDADKQLAGPIGIELAAEIFVGVECHIFPEDVFQPDSGKAAEHSPIPTRTALRRCAG